MSSRSLVGFLILFAVVLSPWFFRDWLPSAQGGDPAPHGIELPADLFSSPPPAPVPPLKGPREKRTFSAIGIGKHQQSGSTSLATDSRRVARNRALHPDSDSVAGKKEMAQGGATPFRTGAKALWRRAATRVSGKVPESKKTQRARDHHLERIEEDLNRLGMRLGEPVFLRIFKEEKELEVWMRPGSAEEYSLFRVYPVLQWSGKVGPKRSEGDLQTPEGFYFVSPSRMIPDHRYHLGFDLGYPNAYDRIHRRTGNQALIHGKSVSNSSFAIGDHNIEEVYLIAAAALNTGQDYFRVHCFPFRMEDGRMDGKIQERPDLEAFWANLKEGYDFFEIMRFPPDTTVTSAGKYSFSTE